MAAMRELAILTAGGHAIDVEAQARAEGIWETVFYDDDPFIADHPRWEHGWQPPKPMALLNTPEQFWAIIGHNDPQVRAVLARRFPQAVWPSVMSVQPWIVHGGGIVIAPGVTITERVELGKHVHVNVGATISQSTTVGDFCTISPGAHICGDVTIGARTWIGAGAIVKDHINIGSDVLVGCGAVVVEDIPDGAGKYVGVPARPLIASTSTGYGGSGRP